MGKIPMLGNIDAKENCTEAVVFDRFGQPQFNCWQFGLKWLLILPVYTFLAFLKHLVEKT